MDFKPIKKDGKPGPDGLFGWESPRLRAALKAAKEAGKQMVAKGLTGTALRTTKDCDMIARDLGGVAGSSTLTPQGASVAERAKRWMAGREAERAAKRDEQAAFERWLAQERPSGDVDQVQSAWNDVREEWLEQEASAERGCEEPFGLAQLEGYGPWVVWGPTKVNEPPVKGVVAIYRAVDHWNKNGFVRGMSGDARQFFWAERRYQANNELYPGVIFAYCVLKAQQ